MTREFRSSALAWADVVVEGTIFLMQIYLTDVWKLSFYSAAAFLNIWGGIYRVLPIIFVFLAGNRRTSRVNFIMLTVSGMFSTMGLVLITYTALPGYWCHEKGEAQCVGRKEKALFITGMALIGLGRAIRFSFTQPMITDNETDDVDIEIPEEVEIINLLDGPSCGLHWDICMYLRLIYVTLFFLTPAVAFFAFPYVKRWYILFGVSAICTILATLSHLSRFRSYNQSAVTNPLSVIKLVAMKFRFLRPLGRHLPDAMGEMESDDKIGNTVIRMVVLYSSWIMCGVVSSIGNTYFVQQATTMNYNIGHWKPPLQVLQLIFLVFKAYFASRFVIRKFNGVQNSSLAMLYSIVCCAVAAAVERRRVHAVRRHGLVEQPDDVRTPMSAFWLLFQVSFLGLVQGYGGQGLQAFHTREAPESMRRYGDFLDEAMTGLGYMCGVLSVDVVGKISETGGGKGWFQHTLNNSRLDRYYWVLATVSAVWAILLLSMPFVKLIILVVELVMMTALYYLRQCRLL